MPQAKTERITILASPELKDSLSRRARAQGLSLAAFARTKLAEEPSADEAMLIELTQELTKATARAARALDAGLRAVHSMEQRISDLHAQAAPDLSDIIELPLQGGHLKGELA